MLREWEKGIKKYLQLVIVRSIFIRFLVICEKCMIYTACNQRSSITLRGAHAQTRIRVYARDIMTTIDKWFERPHREYSRLISHNCLVQYVVGDVRVARKLWYGEHHHQERTDRTIFRSLGFVPAATTRVIRSSELRPHIGLSHSYPARARKALLRHRSCAY